MNDEDLEYEVVSRVQPYLSTIYVDEVITNKKIKTSASDEYFPVTIVDPMSGYRMEALFTPNDINDAIARGEKNPEDFENLEHLMVCPHQVAWQATDIIENLSVWKLFKLWIMRKFGIITSETLGRIIYGQEDKEGQD